MEPAAHWHLSVIISLVYYVHIKVEVVIVLHIRVLICVIVMEIVIGVTLLEDVSILEHMELVVLLVISVNNQLYYYVEVANVYVPHLRFIGHMGYKCVQIKKKRFNKLFLY
jgi:hypothetical protein